MGAAKIISQFNKLPLARQKKGFWLVDEILSQAEDLANNAAARALAEPGATLLRGAARKKLAWQ